MIREGEIVRCPECCRPLFRALRTVGRGDPFPTLSQLEPLEGLPALEADAPTLCPFCEADWSHAYRTQEAVGRVGAAP